MVTPPGGYLDPPPGGTQVWYPPGGVPGLPLGVPRSGYPPGGYLDPPGGTQVWLPPLGGYSGPVPPQGGTQVQYPPGGYPGLVPPQGGTRTPPGGTQVWLPPRGYLDPPGGYPGLATPSGGVFRSGTPPGGTQVRYPPWGYPDPPRGVPRSRYPPEGYSGPVPPRGGTQVWYPDSPPGGGTQVGQQKEYSLHGGRYASCVHAGGLSCFILILYGNRNTDPLELMATFQPYNRGYSFPQCIITNSVMRQGDYPQSRWEYALVRVQARGYPLVQIWGVSSPLWEGPPSLNLD